MNEPTTITCPNCGGNVNVATKAARVAHCPYCESTLIVNEAAIRSLGKMALLAETPSCLAVGWEARCLGRTLIVLGRIQYRYDAGLWDEWWVQFTDDASYAWISQDEGEYMLERPLSRVEAPKFDQVTPGDRVLIGEKRLWVEEKNEATMVGMQGELPVSAAPQGRMQYLDLTDNEVKVTIEYFEDGSFAAFEGQYLKPQELVAPEPSDIDEHARPVYPPPQLSSPPGAPVVPSGAGIRPQAVTCPSCGGSVALVDPEGTAMVVCLFCQAAVDISAPGAARLLYQSTEKQAPFPIPLGTTGHLMGAEWTAIGRVRYQEDDTSGVWVWDELQLFNPEKGYRFLALEEGHWMFFEPLRHRVQADPRLLDVKDRIHLAGQTFKVFERSQAFVSYVEGELSWVARLGDKLGYLDAIRPPQMLSAEWTVNEMEWTIGRYMTPEQVASAFEVSRHELPDPEGEAPAQPFVVTEDQSVRALSGLMIGLMLLLMAGVAYFAARGNPVYRSGPIYAGVYLSERGFLSQPIEIPEGRHICRLEVRSDSVNNSWVAVSVAFLDPNENVLMDADAEVAYYHGVEGGESWSEGSRTDNTLLILDGPETYRLEVFGNAGLWSARGGDRKTTNGPSVEITLYSDATPARYFLIAGIVALIYPAWRYGRQALFESRRWSSAYDEEED